MHARVLFSLALLLLSGCSDPRSGSDDDAPDGGDDEGSCPSDRLRERAFERAKAFFEDHFLVDVAATLTLEGTVEGEVGTFAIAFDPVDAELVLETPELRLDLAGAFYSINGTPGGGFSLVGRNHEPGVLLATFTDMGDFAPEEPSFADNLTWEGYEAVCGETADGVETIEYRYEDDEGNVDAVVVEKARPYRPLSGESVDVALDDDSTIMVAYDDPSATVDLTFPRLPFTSYLAQDWYASTGRGGMGNAHYTSETEWVPFGEVSVHLLNMTHGSLVSETPLAVGHLDLGGGDTLEFTDVDANGFLSGGDTMAFDFASDRDFRLWDLWAEEYSLLP